jgi:hypothetical protein
MLILQEGKKCNKIEGINYIKSHMGQSPVYKDWYVGITNDYEERLFGFHKVDENKSGYVFVIAESNDTARAIEDYFVNSCHTDGGPGGGKDNSDIVYAYKIMPYTRER